MKISLCVPVYGAVPVKFFISFVHTLKKLIDCPDYTIELFTLSTQPTDKSRNRLVKMALESNCDYIWFIDSDMLINKTHLDCLLNLNTDIASALYFAKARPYVPMMMTRNKDGTHSVIRDWKEEVLEVDAIGAGCMLIKSEVFKKIQEPWFEFKPDKGEDVDFCDKAKKAGFKILVHTGVPCAHFGIEVDIEHYLYFKNE